MPARAQQLVDVATVEFGEAGGQPPTRFFSGHREDQAGESVQMLLGVIQMGDWVLAAALNGAVAAEVCGDAAVVESGGGAGVSRG